MLIQIIYPWFLRGYKKLDFSSGYKIVGLKSGSSCYFKVRPINGTVKDKKTVSTQPLKNGAIENQLIKSAE